MSALGDLNAVYLDGKSPIKHKSLVSLNGDQLEAFVENLGVRKTFSLASLQIEYVRPDFLYIHIDQAKGERLEISDCALIEHLQGLKRSFSVDITQNVIQKILLCSLVVAAAGAALWLGTPWVADRIARSVPVEYENKFGTYVQGEISKEICSDQRNHQILQNLADKLLAAGGIKDQNIKVYYGRKGEMNAYAFPGGIAIFYQDLIQKMNSPEVLAGVMAHELEHQVQRHILAQYVRVALTNIVWRMALGDFSGVLVLDPSTLATLASLKYSRDAESEADEKGMELLEKAGIAVTPSLDFIDELGKDFKKLPKFILNHPVGDRTEKLRPRFAHVKTTQEIMPNEDWLFLKTGCIN